MEITVSVVTRRATIISPTTPVNAWPISRPVDSSASRSAETGESSSFPATTATSSMETAAPLPAMSRPCIPARLAQITQQVSAGTMVESRLSSPVFISLILPTLL